MVITFVANKLRLFLLFFVAVFRRALCCFRSRRRVSFDEPLTDIGVVKTKNDDSLAWNDWGDENGCKKPRTVQEHIEFYRQQKAQLQKQKSEEIVEEQADFFEDMTPEITRQKKVLIGEARQQNALGNLNTLIPDAVSMGTELGEWDENPGWEAEQLDWDATKALKQKKRQDRERKFLEQQKKRNERVNKSVGIKLSS